MMKIFILILFIILSNNLLLSQELQSFGLPDKIITSLAVEQGDYNSSYQLSDYIFAGTENGIFETSATNESPDWVSIGLENKSVSALTVQHWGAGPMDGLTLFAAVAPDYEHEDSTLIFRREIYRPIDTNWIVSDSGIYKNANRVNTLNSYYFTGHSAPQPILLGANSGLYQSSWAYYFWTQSEIEYENLQPVINSIDVNPHWWGELAWAAGSIGLSPAAFRSTNSGETWKAFPLVDIDGVGDTATSVAINTRSQDSVYISWNEVIFLTPDKGDNWEVVFPQAQLWENASGVTIKTIAIDRLYPENVFAAGSSSNNELFFIYSTDGGKSWQQPTVIPDIDIAAASSIVVYRKNSSDENGYVFIGTEGTGVWRYKYSTHSSPNKDSSYFPLAINNEWNFSSNLFPRSERITDTLRINGKLYYGLSTEGMEPYVLLRELDNKVFILDLSDSTEDMLYDFNAEVGENWSLSEKYVCSFGLDVTLVSKSDTVETPSGTFYNCFHFSHNPNCADAGITDTWFAKGVGKVRSKEIFFAGMGDFVLTDYIVTSIENTSEPQNDISFKLFQNYPNPFNPTTTIKYELSKESEVQLIIYNLLGEKVAELVNSLQKEGMYEVEWNANYFSSGIYFYSIKAGEFSNTKKLVLLR